MVANRTNEEGYWDESAFRLLVDYGTRRGQLTRDEIIDVIPDAEFDDQLSSRIVRELSNTGITYLDEVAEAIDEDTPLEEVAEASEEFSGEEEGVEIEEPVISPAMLEGIDVDDVVRIYVREAAQVPLLTGAEEVELARRIETCKLAQQELSKGNVPPGRAEELNRLIEAGRAARDRLIRSNARLVISVARKYVGHGVPFSDLIQEGNIGLMRAVRNFDYRRGFKFSTYATWWIRQAITRALGDQSRTVRLPAYLSDQVSRMMREQQRLQQQLGRLPSSEELADVLGTTPARVDQMKEVMRQPVSLQSPFGEDEGDELGDVLEDTTSPNPEEHAERSSLNAEMRKRLETLPERERRVLELRFGLADEEPLTLQDTGERLGITRERARQLEAQALDRLRNPNARRRRRRDSSDGSAIS